MTAPAQAARPRPQPLAPTGLLAWVTTVDHKQIGLLYLGTSFAFFLLGGLEALLMRTQLIAPESDLLSPQFYNQLFTVHGTTMIFFAIMPAAIGFANFLVPLMIGARDVAFARLNALSYWLFLFGGLLFYSSFLHGAAPDSGWFAYPPLSVLRPTSTVGMDYWALALLLSGISSIAGAINLIATIATLRAPGMTYLRMPLFVWSMLVTAFLIIWAMPTLTAAAAMVLLDRLFGARFFLPRFGGDPILYQHLFWWLGHPEVYIMFLPVTGLVSEVIPAHARKPIFGYTFIAGSTVFIGVYSMLVWAHHMLAVGLSHLALGFFSGASLLIAVPTGVKIFNWLATLWGGSIRPTTALLFALGLIVNFTLGGLTGVSVALVPFDWQVTDSYYVVAHLHYVLVGGSLMGLFAAAYHWFPKMAGRMLSERLGRWHFWTTIIGLTLTFFPMHLSGMLGMPRRVYTYPDLPWWGLLNLLSTLGAYLLAASMVLFLANLWRGARHGPRAGANPWDAYTLEWATSSPPPHDNFATIPVVRDRFPLWAERERGAEQRSGTSAPARSVGRISGPFATMERHRLAMLLFISSEAIFFGSLVLTYIVHRGGPGAEARALFDVPLTALFSLALFSSSGTIALAGRRLEQGDRVGMRRWLLLTVVLGLVFLLGQGYEYLQLLSEGVGLGFGIFGSIFFTLTGFHGLHVLVGLVAILALWAVAAAPRFGRRGAAAFEPVALYWHFVDAVWVAIFSVVYLWTLLSL